MHQQTSLEDILAIKGKLSSLKLDIQELLVKIDDEGELGNFVIELTLSKPSSRRHVIQTN